MFNIMPQRPLQVHQLQHYMVSSNKSKPPLTSLTTLLPPPIKILKPFTITNTDLFFKRGVRGLWGVQFGGCQIKIVHTLSEALVALKEIKTG